jgi:hypothetical protein
VKTPAWLRDHRLVASVLLLVTLIAYLPSVMSGAFHFDDGHSIVDNEGVRTLANIPRYFVEPQLWSGEPGNTMYRPVLLVTFALDYAVWGYRASGWLLTNVLIHACVVLLVYRLARRLGLSDLAAAFAGFVFALHPAISETQNYVSSRSESLAALLLIAALHLHMNGGVRGVALSFACLCAALLTKESAAPYCGVVFFYEFLVPRTPLGHRAIRAFAFLWLYCVPATLFLFVVRPWMLHAEALPVGLLHAAENVDPQVGAGRSYVGNMLVQSRVDVLYLRMLFAPFGLSVDHDVSVTAPATKIAAAIAVHLAVIAAAVRSALRGKRLFALCVGWWWALHAVTFAQPLNVVMNEHRLYMPMIAVALLAGAALARVAELAADRVGSSARGMAVAAAPLVCFVPLLVQRAREWRDDETLWTTAVERAPLSGRVHMHLGAVWHERANDEYDRDERVRLLDMALAEYATSDALHAGWADLQLDIGNARLARGKALHDRDDLEKALAAYVRFGEIVGVGTARPRILQAAALSELGRHDEALALARKLRSEDASVTTMYDDLVANILRKKGDKAGAAEAMERVIAIEEPIDRVDGLLQLGWWWFEDGDPVRAEPYLKRALAIARRSHDRRPPLYVIRFLRLVGQGDSPTVDEMEKMARALGWTAPPAEVRWVLGGATPGVFTGTAGRANSSR